MDRLLTGGDSGEHAARELLLMELGPGWNVEQVIDREEGDTLTITAPDGFAFHAHAPRLWLTCSVHKGVNVGPSITIDKFGGTYSVERVPWRWWQRPRWVYRLWHRVPADLLYARFLDWRDGR